MVDSIGPKPGGVPAVAPTPRVERLVNRHDEIAAQPHEVSALRSGAAQAAPIDQKHVEEVRRAVRNGTYPILPETIADRLLALKLNWSPTK